jgi:hypothetical protein
VKRYIHGFFKKTCPGNLAPSVFTSQNGLRPEVFGPKPLQSLTGQDEDLHSLAKSSFSDFKKQIKVNAEYLSESTLF